MVAVVCLVCSIRQSPASCTCFVLLSFGSASTHKAQLPPPNPFVHTLLPVSSVCSLTQLLQFQARRFAQLVVINNIRQPWSRPNFKATSDHLRSLQRSDHPVQVVEYSVCCKIAALFPHVQSLDNVGSASELLDHVGFEADSTGTVPFGLIPLGVFCLKIFLPPLQEILPAALSRFIKLIGSALPKPHLLFCISEQFRRSYVLLLEPLPTGADLVAGSSGIVSTFQDNSDNAQTGALPR